MKDILHTEAAPNAIGPYSQGVKIGDTLYLSGQIPLDPDTQDLVEGQMYPLTIRGLEESMNFLSK